MKLQFKYQKFQAEAARAVCDVFAGQPLSGDDDNIYLIDRGNVSQGSLLEDDFDFHGYKNRPIVPSSKTILENIHKIQYENGINRSDTLMGKYNLTIEMETGVGKTYTYIKTIYELNKRYGWSKFIVVVPSIAIREGVFKSFQVTEDHFLEEYGQKIRYFIYDSGRLTDIDVFARDRSINVMIINSQAFNSRGKDARKIYMELDEFRSRRPIDIINKTNPIMIIDEPQSVEGKQTKENLKAFGPLLTLRYSATHRKDSIYNMIYRLDAIDAYNKDLVKKIAVKGISESKVTVTNGFVYLERIDCSENTSPKAVIHFNYKGAESVRQITRKVSEKFNLYDNSNELNEYQDRYIITKIDGDNLSVEFANGKIMYTGEMIGKSDESGLRQIQIYETILSHLERERLLFHKKIKVLSLFFIDKVENYRQYDKSGNQIPGEYAKIFEEEYNNIINAKREELQNNDPEYLEYLDQFKVEKTHAGYFSIDKNGRVQDSKLANKKEETSDDIDAFDLIMKDKERLLDCDPERSPVRFIFSHSALREGWDNPNVFQICTLKQSSSEVRKRQEVGRGLRLCVNNDGLRMDHDLLGKEFHDINLLTVIASESYDEFADSLQKEMAESITDRPLRITPDLFVDKTVFDIEGNSEVLNKITAQDLYDSLIEKKYLKSGTLTEKYYEDKVAGKIFADDDRNEKYAQSLIDILESVYDPKKLKPENALKNDIELKFDQKKWERKEFQKLWEGIKSKSVYTVKFDENELVKNAVIDLDEKLLVSPMVYNIETGTMNKIDSKEELMAGGSFKKLEVHNYDQQVSAKSSVKYDLVGNLTSETGLTRKNIVEILKKIKPETFELFKVNPEEFILKAQKLIVAAKATVIIQHITYNKLEEVYDKDVFTDPTIRGKLGTNAIKTDKHLYQAVVYDSQNEKNFVEGLETGKSIVVYVKLPGGFFISTPVGNYNPDWAIAFEEGSVKHIYFVAETKGSLDSLELRETEKSKIECARKHFSAISNNKVIYDVVDSYKNLMEKVMK